MNRANGTTAATAACGTETRDGLEEYIAPNFIGSYAFHLTGSLFLPPPYDSSNGPFFRIARFHSDGSGHIEISTVIANYGGRVVSEKYNATYTVHPDGSFIIEATDVPMPGVPAHVPHVITLEGVFADAGDKAVLGVTRFSLDGQNLANVGSVISGQILRQ